jgi:phosphoserine aminotransferase
LVLQLVLEWMRDRGGLEAMERHNVAKAKILYDALDASALYVPRARPGHRSNMNVCFTLDGAPADQREALTKRFVTESEAAGFSGLKGHRSAGGCRASIYNAFPAEGVTALVEFMREFERRA